MRSHKGFTLVEMVVVIAIIGVLAAILVPSLMTYIKKARLKTANGNAKTAYNAIIAFFIEKESQGIGRDQLIADYCNKEIDCRVPPSMSMDTLQLEVHDTLAQNGIDSGLVYINHDTIGGVDTYYVHWIRAVVADGPDCVVGQYPDPVSWSYFKQNGGKWKTYMH